jgi:tetratricopeptide (TPR) repeat protein
MLLSCGTLFVLALAAYWAARLAWADRLSTSPRLEDRRRAVLLAPLDATFYSRLAEKLEDDGGDPLPSLKAAAALDPDNPQWRMNLGQRAELAGDLALAEESLLAAARVSRLYQPRYLLADYYLRRGNADLCIRWSKAALAIAPGDVTPVLNLLGRLLAPQAMAAEGMRQPPAVERQFLAFLAAHGQAAAAVGLARQLAQTGTDEDLPALAGYANQLLAEGHGLDTVAIWNPLCTRQLLPCQPLDVPGGKSLTNGGFARSPLGYGFDWHAEGAPGLGEMHFDGALRATFSGDQMDDCMVIWQYIPLQMGARYRLRQEVHAENSVSAAGLQWRLFYPQGGPVWPPLAADLSEGFRAPAEVARLALMYRRAPGSTRLTGEFSVTGLRLDREP